MLKDLITSKTRVKVLSVFLRTPSEMHHVREVVRLTGEEINAVRRELALLEKKGIFKKEPRSNRVYYYLDKNYPFYFDLIKLFAKMEGLGADIIEQRVKLGKIKYAMLSGKFVRDIKTENEGVDLLVVGMVVIPELTLLVKNEQAKKNIEINYTVMTEEEFTFRKKRRDPFILSILAGSIVMLIGDEESMLS